MLASQIEVPKWGFKAFLAGGCINISINVSVYSQDPQKIVKATLWADLITYYCLGRISLKNL